MASVVRDQYTIPRTVPAVTIHPEGALLLTLLRPVGNGDSTRSISAYWPDLAPGVELLGEAPGTGYAQKMWLVQYYGRFIQLTELLYRVAEYCDGTNSLADIAAQVSWSTEWQINADDVEYLLNKKLIPTGIITLAAVADSHRAATDAQSLIRLGLRTKVIGARAIEPVARRLRFLYWPAVVAPLLIAGLLAHAWLYLYAGPTNILAHTIQTPGLLLLILIASILPRFWHEFGHATALRYGGGRARSIGVGIYVMDPAFYTDVTDSYRLPRGARVRTGLGGVYFDLILSTIMIGLYAVTGWQPIVILVFLNNLNSLFQFVPIVRLDGYWVLADLSGVPDFFALIPAFLRSILPLHFWKGQKLPPLKRSAKIVLAFYTLVGFPAMMIFLAFFAMRIPGLLTTSINALQHDGLMFFIALYEGVWLNVAALGGQLALLIVTLIGLVYFIFTMIHTYFMALIRLLFRLVGRLRPNGEVQRSPAA